MNKLEFLIVLFSPYILRENEDDAWLFLPLKPLNVSMCWMQFQSMPSSSQHNKSRVAQQVVMVAMAVGLLQGMNMLGVWQDYQMIGTGLTHRA